MPSRRLLKALTSVDPQEIERVFGNEYALHPRPSVELAPVRRVAIFAEAFFPKIDGVSKSAFLTLRYLQQTGREVLVFAPDISPDQVGPSRIIRCPSVGLPFAPETRLALPTPMIRHHLREFKPDLVHLFSPALLSARGMALGRRMHVPVVANYQTDLPAYARHYGFGYLANLIRNSLRYVHNGCHLTLAPSQFTLNQIRDQGYRRLRIWPRGVDLDRFNPGHRRAEWRQRLLNGRPDNSLLCIYVGRLATEKRIELLVETAKLPGVALTIIGDGAERARLEKQFADTDTYFTGYLTGDDLGNAYASGDVFMFPSPTETFGQVVQEAMASGLPAIIINQGGIIDLVADGETGFICHDDPQAFAQAVQKLRDDPALRQQMAENARAKTLRYPWENIMAQLEDYYREAVDLNQRFNRVYPRPRFWRRRQLPETSQQHSS
ncbi:MAG: glycosyltransferase family 1 protein [Chloroflexi bacterium]|nr:glycosyltransferase family 1 protein [Chloroflexota bacterium]